MSRWLMFSRGWCRLVVEVVSFQVEANADVTRNPDLWSIHRPPLMQDATDNLTF